MVLTTLLFCMLIGFDGLLWGAIIGYKRVYFSLGQLLFLSAGVGVIFFFTYLFGSLVGVEISTSLLNRLSGMVFLAVGLLQLTHSGRFLFARLVRNLFIIVNIDNIGYGVVSGVQEVHPVTGVFVAAAFFVLFVFGMVAGSSARFKFLARNNKVLPSLILIVIGTYKLLFS
ncbi:hypothetical protein [Alteribacter natronophilus]|uniref:hypothetical protein n=1 Tax=Alteribacter natronophilus TaxID=2583810 RepID=UPI00110DDD7D|nr:hypothetical protein [Alteribacter natronophilus]TMW70312.1 hypothetical protein FGB90_16690 [Alteribacter natronophilus]